MNDRTWTTLTHPLGAEPSLWELFHENSKGSAHERTLPPSVVAAHASQLAQSLDLSSCSVTTLPAPTGCGLPVTEALAHMSDTGACEQGTIAAETLATILHHAYGAFPAADDRGAARRPVVPMGAVHTLELFVHCSRIDGIGAGLFHYCPAGELRLLRRTDHSHHIASHVRDQNLAYTASAVVFIAALPERAVLIYGERGYRYTLIEAGAVLQNLTLVSRALGVACVATGEYFDRRMDAMLGFDGITMSTVGVAMLCRAGQGTTSGSTTTAHSSTAK